MALLRLFFDNLDQRLLEFAKRKHQNESVFGFIWEIEKFCQR